MRVQDLSRLAGVRKALHESMHSRGVGNAVKLAGLGTVLGSHQ